MLELDGKRLGGCVAYSSARLAKSTSTNINFLWKQQFLLQMWFSVFRGRVGGGGDGGREEQSCRCCRSKVDLGEVRETPDFSKRVYLLNICGVGGW